MAAMASPIRSSLVWLWGRLGAFRAFCFRFVKGLEGLEANGAITLAAGTYEG